MDAAVIRAATLADVEELVELRRAFTLEDDTAAAERPGYAAECRAFLAAAIGGGAWRIWVAELDGSVAAHVFVALVEKVPRPVRECRRIAYLTNVYARPELRGRGIGGRLLRHAQHAAAEDGVELMFVWPGEESVAFYERHGFASEGEPLVWHAAAS